MTSESTDKPARNGLNQYSNFDADTFSKSNTRKGSFTSSVCDRVAQSSCQARWPQTNYKNYANGGRGSNYKKQSFRDDSTEGEYQKVDNGSSDYGATTTKHQSTDDTRSTELRKEGPQFSNFTSESIIDFFKVVVMGDEFDGIKAKALPNARFAAASAFKSPEANDLCLPYF